MAAFGCFRVERGLNTGNVVLDSVKIRVKCVANSYLIIWAIGNSNTVRANNISGRQSGIDIVLQCRICGFTFRGFFGNIIGINIDIIRVRINIRAQCRVGYSTRLRLCGNLVVQCVIRMNTGGGLCRNLVVQCVVCMNTCGSFRRNLVVQCVVGVLPGRFFRVERRFERVDRFAQCVVCGNTSRCFRLDSVVERRVVFDACVAFRVDSRLQFRLRGIQCVFKVIKRVIEIRIDIINTLFNLRVRVVSERYEIIEIIFNLSNSNANLFDPLFRAIDIPIKLWNYGRLPRPISKRYNRRYRPLCCIHWHNRFVRIHINNCLHSY